MKVKDINNKLAKVQDLQAKVVTINKEIDNILLSITSQFKKDQIVNYLDKNNNQVKGKVLYFRGQKSLTIVTLSNEKINVTLDKLVLT